MMTVTVLRRVDETVHAHVCPVDLVVTDTNIGVLPCTQRRGVKSNSLILRVLALVYTVLLYWMEYHNNMMYEVQAVTTRIWYNK